MHYKIEKVLEVDSPIQFYKILIDKNWMTGGVDEFLKAWFRWERGCPCDSEVLWEKVKVEFNNLENKDLTGLAKKIGCDKIKFNDNN